MGCREGITDEQVESYALGRLDEEAMKAFEDHYFGCRECLERLEALQALPTALGGGGRPAHPPGRVFPRRALPVWVGVAASLAALATAWLGLRLTTGRPGDPAETPPTLAVPTTAPALVAWARITPPRFQPPSLRGPHSQSPEFEAAMERYARSDYAGAIGGLEEAVRLRPGDAAALFFLGACYLLADRAPEGIGRLEETIALGESPYLEEARVYLARALVREGRLEEAAAQLQQALEMQGDLEDEIREGLRHIRESRPREE